MKKVFDVLVERGEDGWLVAPVPGLHGCHTQARTLERRMERVREAVELCTRVSSTTPTPMVISTQPVEVAI
ncbi:MAG TPA: type II toxin-antitoxin system HicB family antitoxin [Longimicrobium sp.]